MDDVSLDLLANEKLEYFEIEVIPVYCSRNSQNFDVQRNIYLKFAKKYNLSSHISTRCEDVDKYYFFVKCLRECFKDLSRDPLCFDFKHKALNITVVTNLRMIKTIVEFDILTGSIYCLKEFKRDE